MRTKLLILLSFSLFFGFINCEAQTLPIAITDSVIVYANERADVNVLDNDQYDQSHSIKTYNLVAQNLFFPGDISVSLSGIMSIKPDLSVSGTYVLYYKLTDATVNASDTGSVIITILPMRNAAYLDINSTKALVNYNGCLFWDMENNNPQFLIPADSVTSTVFSVSLMVGGKDSQQNNYFMFDPFNLSNAIFAGPLDTTDGMNDSLSYTRWNRVWKISKDEILTFRSHYWESSYTIPEAILNWPAYGDVSKGQPHFLAPFVDINNDNEYDPLSGDYPFIRGDQAVLFLCNNPVNNTKTNYSSTGMQAIGMVYGYKCTSDTLFNTAVFIDYTVINSNILDFTDSYVGLFSEFDIGNRTDDYMGTFVDLNSIYAYNGDSFDESIPPLIDGYGLFPPAQGLTLLKGPLADDYDGVDNDYDNEIDEPGETCGMYSSVIINYMDPGFALMSESDCFNALSGYFNDSIPIKWGQPSPSDTSSASPCRYMFPGTSDPNWLGTGGVPQTPAVWTEYLMNDVPYDRRGIMSFGPFSFNKNDRKSFTVALVYAQQNGLPYYQVPDLLHARIETLLDYYTADSIPCGGSFSGIAQPSLSTDFNIYPNPASDMVTIEFAQSDAMDNYAIIRIFNLSGQCVMTLPFTGQKTIFSASGLHEGIYFVQISNDRFSESKRLVIVR